MRKSIIEKMNAHVETILGKEKITSEDFSNLQAFLAILDFEESKKRMEEDSKKNDERFSKAMGLILGGGLNGV
ncbi:MAG: hypothetical protein IJX67_10275 [Oscillospiraceae bacterium]|nr:hypothetical protein [Oscillospiraceae bacterium]